MEGRRGAFAQPLAQCGRVEVMFPAEVRLRGIPGVEAAKEFFALFRGTVDSTGSTTLGVHAPADSSLPDFWEGGGPPDAYFSLPYSGPAWGTFTPGGFWLACFTP